MKRKFSISILAIVVTVTFILGFSSSNPTDKDPNSKRGIGNYIVKGPQLDDPLSTLNESFEGTTFPPAGWIKLSPDGGTGWDRETNGTTPIPGWTGGIITVPPGGGNAVAFCTWTTGGPVFNNQWLITPQLTNMQSGDSLKFWLRFWPDAIYSDTIDIKISTTTPTAAAFNINVATIVFPQNSSDTNWTQYKYNIGSMIPSGSNIYIAFRERVNDNLNEGASVSLDLVSVTAGAAPPPTCTYGWTSQTSGITTALLTNSTVSDMIGWAAGSGPAVRRTTDGGSTWSNATGTGITGDIYNIYAWSANDAICTTSPAATFIYKTSNGGTTWTQVYTLAGGFIDGLQMISPTVGYGMGDPVGGTWTIVKTTDGGASWARMATEPVQVGAEAGWNNSFYIEGNNIWFNTNVSTVYRSTDLGLTWSSSPIAPVTSTTYGSVHYNSSTLGIASGSAGIVRSTDGGVSYTTAGTIPGTGNITALEGYANYFWYVRGTGVFISADGGLTFTSAFTATSGTFNDMDFAVNGCPSGWAVTSSGAIYKMSILTGISGTSEIIPDNYSLKQNYPNPFNPTTNINFSIPKSGLVTLKIYDMTGKEVATLVNEVKSAGSYLVGFNASNLPSGAYFYRVSSGNFVDTKKMMLIK